MQKLPRGVRPLSQLINNTNGYWVRVLEKECLSKPKAGNWQPLKPNKHRFDLFIQNYISPTSKRCYFCANGFIETFEHNLWFPINERCRDEDKVNGKDILSTKDFGAFRLYSAIINELLPIEVLKSYYFIDLDAMRVEDKLWGQDLIQKILSYVDVSAAEYKQIQNQIVALRVNSKYIGETSFGCLPYGAQNIIILDNNPLYNLLVNTPTLWEPCILPDIEIRPEK